jgi:hypothetical protein
MITSSKRAAATSVRAVTLPLWRPVLDSARGMAVAATASGLVRRHLENPEPTREVPVAPAYLLTHG